MAKLKDGLYLACYTKDNANPLFPVADRVYLGCDSLFFEVRTDGNGESVVWVVTDARRWLKGGRSDKVLKRINKLMGNNWDVIVRIKELEVQQ
jgi:hypothetical protein